MSSASSGYQDEFGMPLYVTTGEQFKTELFERVFIDAIAVSRKVHKELIFLAPKLTKGE